MGRGRESGYHDIKRKQKDTRVYRKIYISLPHYLPNFSQTSRRISIGRRLKKILEDIVYDWVEEFFSGNNYRLNIGMISNLYYFP